MAVTEEQVFEFFDKANLLEISEFIKKFETRYGVSAAAPVAVGVAGGAAAAGAAPAEEKTAFDVIKKQTAYPYWVTKAYILLGDIYVAQKDTFNAMATYKSVFENAEISELKNVAEQKLNALNAKQ